MCRSNDIVSKEEEKKRKGWVNKQKGLLQVLYERGQIDQHNYKDYTEKGKIVGYGNRDESKSD